MKNILMLLFISLVMIACGGKEDKQDSSSRKWSKDDTEMFSEKECEPYGISEANCNCVISELSKDYSSYKDFENKSESMLKMRNDIDISSSGKTELEKFYTDMAMINEKCEDDDGMYDDGEMYDDEPAYESSYNSTSWTDYQINELVDDCMAEGAPSRDVCECMVGTLSDIFTYSEFKSIEDKNDNDLTEREQEKTQEFMRELSRCMP